MQKKGLENDGNPRTYWDCDKWREAQESDPAIVTIMLGTNDTKLINWPQGEDRAPVFCQDYKEMIKIMQAMP